MRSCTKLLIIGVFLSMGLGGCATLGHVPPTALAPICKALIGPIRYNSLNVQSKRFAAALLAMDLKQRNAVGRRLHCPLYK